jgi:hypothetical protein
MTQTSPDSITSDALTLALRHSGDLVDGCVSAIDAAQPRSTLLSRIVRLKLAYEGEAPFISLSKIGRRIAGLKTQGADMRQRKPRVPAATEFGSAPRLRDQG